MNLKFLCFLILSLVFSSLLGGMSLLPVSGNESSTDQESNSSRSPKNYLHPLLNISSVVYDFELYGDSYIIATEHGIQIYPLQEIKNFSRITTIPLPGAVKDILIMQDVLIALCDGFGIAGINLQDLEGEINPIFLELEGSFTNIVEDGEYLFVSCGEQGIATVQMSQIESSISEFILVSLFPLDNQRICDITFENGKLFAIILPLGDYWNYLLVIIDYAEPSQPILLYESLSIGSFIEGIIVKNNTIYYWDYFLKVFCIWTYETPNNVTYRNHLYLYNPIKDTVIVDEIAYFALGTAGFGFMNVLDYESIEQPSTIPLNDVALKIKVSGQKAYVLIGTHNSGYAIQIIDLSDPYIKTYTEAIKTYGQLDHMVIKDSIAYTGSSSWFQIYDIENPMHPELLSTIDINASILDIKTDGNELYISNFDNGIFIFNITSLTNPVLISNITLNHPAWDIEISDGYAYLANHGGGLTVVNISNSENPQIITSIQLSDESGWAREIALQNNFVYLACGNGGFEIIDITNPAQPTSVSVLDTYGNAANIEIRNSIVYLSQSWGDFLCINVSNPYEPQIISRWGMNGVFTFYKDELYILRGSNRLYRLNITDLSDISTIDRIQVDTYNVGFNLLNIHKGIIYYGDESVWYQFNYTSYVLNFNRTEINLSIGRISTWEISDIFFVYSVKGCPYFVIKSIQEPQVMWVISVVNPVTSIAIRENRVYLAFGINELLLVDVSTDGRELDMHKISTSEEITKIVLHNDYIIVHNGATICNILKDNALATVDYFGNFITENDIVDIKGYKNHLFIQTENHKVIIFDISNPVLPICSGEIDYSTFLSKELKHIAIENNHLFLQFYDEIQIYKIENPLQPEYVTNYHIYDITEFVVIENYVIGLTDFGQFLEIAIFSKSYSQGDFYYVFDLESQYVSLKSRAGKIYFLSSNFQVWEFDFEAWIQHNKLLNWLTSGGILIGIAVFLGGYIYIKKRK